MELFEYFVCFHAHFRYYLIKVSNINLLQGHMDFTLLNDNFFHVLLL